MKQQSLYEIQEELLSLFADIEEAGGEITPEQEELLSITEDNFKEKLNNYYKLVLSFDADALASKNEAKRLTDRRKVLENRVERLKKTMLGAVEMFGANGKTGNKFIELPTVRIFTRGANSVKLDEERINNLIREIVRLTNEIHDNGALVFGEDCDVEGLLCVINVNLKAEYDNKYGLVDNNNDPDKEPEYISAFIPYTILDLDTIDITISSSTNLLDLISAERSLLPAFLDNQEKFNLTPSTIKEKYKNAIETVRENEEDVLTVATIERNYSLQMK